MDLISVMDRKHRFSDIFGSMEGKGRVAARNWDFSDHTSHSDSMVEPTEGNASGYQSGFLKMSSYSNRNALIDEHDSEASLMEFSWFPPRSFLSPPKESTHQVEEEVNNASNVSTQSENRRECGEYEGRPAKVRKQKPANRIAAKTLRPKEPKKQPSVPRKKKVASVSTGKKEKRNQDDTFEGTLVDFSSVPAPVCSCTGVPRQCYRWGSGGWQSSCCTTSISEYPLPISSSRPGARLAGRKMSIGAYGKLLRRLANEGHDLSYAVDLKDHWARHGTNKFVTIR